VYRWRIGRWWCAEIRAPQPIAASDGRGTLTAERVRSCEASQVAAEAAARARYKERHRGRGCWHVLRLYRYSGDQCGDDKRLKHAHRNNRSAAAPVGVI